MLATLTNTLVFAQAEAGGEEEGGSFLVSPSIGLMVWTLFLFGVSLFILWKVAFPRIAEALDRRQKAIEESIDTAERTRSEADELLAEYRERLTAARQQADEIVARARKAGEQDEADAVAHGQGSAARSCSSRRARTSRRRPAARSRRSAPRSPTSRSSPPRRSRARR